MRRFFEKGSWKYWIAFLVPTFAVLVVSGTLDNDSWYVLAEGRQIVEHGVYYTDELSMHGDFEVTVQNYGFAVVFYLIHAALGAPGIYAVLLILNFVIMFLLYKICMLISDKNVKLSLILMSVTDLLLACGFVVTRAQMVDYVIILGLIYVLELYIKTDSGKYLWWIPLMSLTLINMHASSWWMIFIVIVFYMIDGVKKEDLGLLQGYKLKPLFIVTVVALAVGLINPYGIRMITFIFTSYGGMANLNLVNELMAFKPIAGFNPPFFLAIVAVIWLYAFGNKKYVRVRYLLMFFVFLMLGLNSVKGLSEMALVMFFPMARVYKDWKMPVFIDVPKIRWGAIAWTGVMVICVTAAMTVTTLYLIDDKPREILVGAINAIDEVVPEEIAKRDLKVYVGYNDGGYVEYRGYGAYIDPRGEVFLKSNNGKEDVLNEYIDLGDGKIDKEEFLKKYEFDFVVAEKGRALYDLESDEYELIYDGGGENHGDRVYRRI